MLIPISVLNTKEKITWTKFFYFSIFWKTLSFAKKNCIYPPYFFIGIHRFPIRLIVTAKRLKIYLLAQIEMRSKFICLIFNIITPRFTLFASNLSMWQEGRIFLRQMRKFPNNLISFYRTDRLILIIYPSLVFQKKKGKKRKRGNVGKVSSSSHAKLDRRKIITLKVGKGTRRERKKDPERTCPSI